MSAAVRISVTCWCEATEVMVPVEWVSEGRTASCHRDGCAPGCATCDTTDDWAEPSRTTPIPTQVRSKRMNAFNPSKYDPAADSSAEVSHAVRASYPRDLILVLDHNACACGCGQLPAGKRSVFRQGHDARMRGKLIRAAATGVRVVTVDEANGHTQVHDPIQYAVDNLDTPTHRLSEQVVAGVQRVADRKAAKAAPVTVIAKVGRWPREGVVKDGEFIYAEKSTGTTQRTRKFTILADAS